MPPRRVAKGYFIGIVEIPVFSDIFYREKISDLGIETVLGAAESLEQK